MADATREELLEGYEAWKNAGQRMDRVLLSIWKTAVDFDASHMTYGDDPEVVEQAVLKAYECVRKDTASAVIEAIEEAHSNPLGGSVEAQLRKQFEIDPLTP